jgi:hypothetical protein
MGVESKSAAVEAMEASWSLVSCLMGGTDAMRAAGRTYLPQMPMEGGSEYTCRLAVATLFPAFSETVGQMAGRLFSEPLQIGDDVPSVIIEQLGNADLEGRNIDGVAGEWFSKALEKGLCHALVDFPPMEGVVANAAEERASGARPYIVLIDPINVLGWRSQRINGIETLLQVRIIEAAEEDDGEFGTASVSQIRVIEPTGWRTYREQGEEGKKEWVLHEEGSLSLGKIPLVTLYTKRTGFMQGKPPLLELAHLNVKHWQSQSDQDTILHTARVPLLARIGADFGEDGAPVVIASSTIDLPTGGDIKYVEHTGAAIGAGAESLVALEEQMKAAGAKVLTKTVLSLSDNQAKDESDKELSQLGRMARSLEDALDQVLQLFADWQKLPDGGSIEVVADLDADVLTGANVDVLLDSVVAGTLSPETYFEELKRRSLISDELEWVEEQARIKAQKALMPQKDPAPTKK